MAESPVLAWNGQSNSLAICRLTSLHSYRNLLEETLSRAIKRIVGNVSVLTALVALVAVLVFAATSPSFLKNDAKLTAEANAGTPIVQARTTPKPTPTSSATPSETVYPTSSDGVTIRPWEDIQIAGYLENNGANSFKGWSEGTPQRATDYWESETEGELTIIVSDDGWTESDMEDYARSFMSFYGCNSDEVERVTVETAGGDVSATRSGC